MSLRLLDPNEGARNMGNLVWLEDLEKRGLSYGDLLGFLEGLHWKCVCSPIHDRDVYTVDDVKGWKKRHTNKETHEISEEDLQRCPEVGAPKKPHIHVYHCFKGARKPKDIAKYWSEFIPEVTEKRFVYVPDWGSIVRYCAHMDAPNKAQYDPCSIHGFANADISSIWDASNFNKTEMLLELHKVIKEKRIPNYKRLMNYALTTGDVNMIGYVKGNHSHFMGYFAADRQEKCDRAAKKTAGQQAG